MSNCQFIMAMLLCISVQLLTIVLLLGAIYKELKKQKKSDSERREEKSR